jgi:hypothetical protein
MQPTERRLVRENHGASVKIQLIGILGEIICLRKAINGVYGPLRAAYPCGGVLETRRVGRGTHFGSEPDRE